jgi:hypothetical protein
MTFAIEWTTPLNRAERRNLRCWLERFPSHVFERRPGAIVVHDSNLEPAHTFAALTMAVIGRDPLAYVLVDLPEQPEGRMAA